MKYIYYPEYELEYRNLLRKRRPADHILNIRLLMFLCDHVILPPSHLLYTDSDNILSLIHNLKDFFNAGKIVTTQYQGGMDEYFASRIDRIQDPVLRLAREIRANQIEKELFFNPKVEHNVSDEETQLSLFDTRVRELLCDSAIHKRKSKIVLDRMGALADETGEPVHSNQLRDILGKMAGDGEITKQQNGYFMQLMSNAYYYSGTYTMNTMVSYNEYFQKIDLQNSLLYTNKQAANLIVSPYFLRDLLCVMGMDMQDIYRLTVSDYQTLMSHKRWKEFMAIFTILYTDGQELDALLGREKQSVENWHKVKENVFRILDIFFNNMLLNLALPVLFRSPVIANGISVLIALLKTYLPPAQKIESVVRQNTVDRILDLIECRRDPLYDFGYRLSAVIRALQDGDV